MTQCLMVDGLTGLACDLGIKKTDGDSTGLQSILQMETFPLLYYTGARHDEVGLSLFEQVVYGSPLGFS